MRQQRLQVEIRLDGELYARYQGRYLGISRCGMTEEATAEPAVAQSRRGPNAGGKSQWMQGFFDRPEAPLWTSLR